MIGSATRAQHLCVSSPIGRPQPGSGGEWVPCCRIAQSRQEGEAREQFMAGIEVASWLIAAASPACPAEVSLV
ncbi:MAG: hypothetical protein ACM3ML_20650, partial [Micromonosporaceae bacterium]